MPGTPVIVVDTSCFYSDLSLENEAWKSLLYRCHEQKIILWIPEIVIRETVRHYNRSLGESIRSMRTGLAPLRALRLDVDLLPKHKDLEKSVREKAEGFEERLRAKLRTSNARVLPLPHVSHDELLTRALMEKKPFRNKGLDPEKRGPDGYRDALIWMSVVEASKELNSDNMLVIVTNNHKDFCDRDDENLSLDLLADLQMPHPTVKRVKNLQELQPLISDSSSHVTYTPPPPDREIGERIRRAIIGACDELLGARVANPDYEWSDSLQFEDIELPPTLQSITIERVEPEIETVDLSSYDDYDSGPSLAHLTVKANVQFDGFMDKFDYRENDSEVELHDGDWSSYAVWVFVERNVELMFHATVDSSTGEIELTFERGGPAA
ncbi:PIN domain-containing protein [Streptomyces sp. NPDC002133]|uniref:PIN domain-containing protein n=1 Tax=Streptomyces sp. NPDC002133 TaxID=3154409 RepID=UPI0033200162